MMVLLAGSLALWVGVSCLVLWWLAMRQPGFAPKQVWLLFVAAILISGGLWCLAEKVR